MAETSRPGHGRARQLVTNEGEIAAFERVGLELWGVDRRSRWIRIRAQVLAGRRIEHVHPQCLENT